jgi:hypothetical protein
MRRRQRASRDDREAAGRLYRMAALLVSHDGISIAPSSRLALQ